MGNAPASPSGKIYTYQPTIYRPTTLDDFVTAGETRNVEKVREILRENPEKWREAKDKNGYTLLHWAAQKEHVETGKYLIKKGANVKAQDKEGRTPFLVACICGHVSVAKLLLEKECNRYVKNSNKDGALVLNEKSEMTNEMRFDVDETFRNGYTALHYAARKGRVEIAEYLIEKGANVEAQDNHRSTPFLVACLYGQVSVAKLLLKRCNRHAKDTYGNGALAYAIWRGKTEMVETLVEMKFDVNETHRNGYTPLHWAAREGHVEIAKCLIEEGANVEAQDKQGHKASALACIRGHYDTAQYLLSNANDKTKNDHAVLHLTVKNDFHKVIALLISMGANVESKDQWGCTLFLTAVEFGCDNAIDLLIQKGCDIHATTDSGECALDMAIFGGRFDLIKRFIDAGIGVNKISKNSLEFIRRVADNGNEEAMKYYKEIEIERLKAQVQEQTNRFLAAEERHAQEMLILRRSLETARRERDESARYSLRREEEVERMRKASATLRTRARKAESEIKQLRIQHTELRAADEEKKERLTTAARLVEERQRESITAKRTIRDLKTELAALIAAAEEGEKALAAETKMNEDLKTERTVLIAAAEEGEKALAAETKMNEDLKTERTVLIAAAEEGEKALAAETRMNEYLRTERTVLIAAAEERKKALAAETRMNEYLRTERTVLIAAAEEKTTALIAATTDRDRALREIQRQQELLGQMERTVANLTRAGEEKDARIKKLNEYDDLLKIPIEDVQLTGVQLGVGSYGEVRIGRWRGALVAVKLFHEELQQADHYRTLFHREMEICARVRHPNIVSICGATTVDDKPLRIISNLLEGSLRDVITAAPLYGGELTLREKTDLGIGFVAGISYLHQLLPTPILHGDVRSTNVLVMATMEAQVGDLGSARFANVSLSAGPHSPEYIAPERNERHGNTAKADVYSLGVTLAEVMTCKEPNREERHTQVGMIQHEEIRDLCLQMIDDTPTERPKAHACLEILEAVCSTGKYRECPPKRLVRGKAHGHGKVVLANRLEELS